MNTHLLTGTHTPPQTPEFQAFLCLISGYAGPGEINSYVTFHLAQNILPVHHLNVPGSEHEIETLCFILRKKEKSQEKKNMAGIKIKINQ